MHIDIPEIIAEIEAVFARYEDALVNNKIDVLNELFWNDPRTLRFGVNENLYGYAEISAFRNARPASNLARTILRKTITTYGRDVATTHIEFRRHGTDRVGRQSQTWVRMPEGWRVVAAHVSVI